MSVAEMAKPVAAAEELLQPEKEEENDDDELEALRLAALNSIRRKKVGEFKMIHFVVAPCINRMLK